MSDQRTKARLAVSEFQSALRTRFEADRDIEELGGLIRKLGLVTP